MTIVHRVGLVSLIRGGGKPPQSWGGSKLPHSIRIGGMTKFLPALLSLALLAATPYDPSKVVPDLDQRIQKFQKVDMPFSMEDLSPAERKTVNELIAASRDLEQIYWRQNNPEDIELYKEAAREGRACHPTTGTTASRLKQINKKKPFYGTEPIPPGRNLYPQGL